MDKSNKTDAIVVGVLRNAMFKLELPNKKIIIARISGKIRNNNIRILLGDKVQVDSTKRIVYRYIDKKNHNE
ncbi:MAG: translation initiation factor IF-1 [Vigna little leaf phytoplasma]|nr:translation initiation factor IF-1 [Vigna little leaf phytoplasma]MDV3198123.1 translation initiation factor IF-1 [Vigna little leaf phytoplasma]